MTDTRNDEDARTLYVRGITDEVDEEILFELFQNVSTKLNLFQNSFYSVFIKEHL